MAEAAQKLYDLLKADANCKSLLAKNLTQERFDLLKDKTTKFGGTLADCIRS
ncbi:arginine kinase, partial [Biomphalaria glabrata]